MIKKIFEKMKNRWSLFRIGVAVSFSPHRYDKKMTCSLSFDETFQEDLLVEMLCKKYNIRGTLYAVHEEVKNGGWWDTDPKGGYVRYNHQKGYTRRYTLSEKQLVEIDRSGTFTISNHSYGHLKPSTEISTLDEKKREIIDNKKWLEKILKRPVTGFAYPYGATEKEYCKIVAENHLYGRRVGPCISTGSWLQWFSYKYPAWNLGRLSPSTSLHYVNNPKAHHKYFLYTQYPTHVFDKAYKSGGWFRVYGHSETDMSINSLWEDTEKFFEYIANRNDVYYCSYEDAIEYQLLRQAMKYSNLKYDKVNQIISFATSCDAKYSVHVTVKVRMKMSLWLKINKKIGVKIDEKIIPIIIDEKHNSVLFEVENGIHDIEISNGYNSPYLDLNKPVIRNVQSDRKTIKWNTNQDCDSIVYYTLKSNPAIKDFSVLGRDLTRTNNHIITIPDALKKQTFYYAVASTNDKGISGWDDNNQNLFPFINSEKVKGEKYGFYVGRIEDEPNIDIVGYMQN